METKEPRDHGLASRCLKKAEVPILIFLLVALVYAATAKGTLGVSDSLLSLRTAQAIVDRGSLALDQSHDDGEDFLYNYVHDGKAYSKYGIGLPLLWLPYVLVGNFVAARGGLPADLVTRFLLSFYNVAFGAGACVVMFYLARFFKASGRFATAVALLLGLCTMAWRYSVWTLSEATQMCLLLCAVYGVLRGGRRSLLAGAGCFAFMVLLKIFSLIYVPVFLAYIIVRYRSSAREALGRVAAFLAPVALAGVLIATVNYARFGSAFETGYGGEALQFYPRTLPRHLILLLFSPERGLFVYNPILILGVLGFPWLLKAARREALFFLGLIVVNLCTIAMWHDWDGGWAWGPRYLVPTLPLYLLPLLGYAHYLGRARWCILPIALVSLAVQVVGVLENNFEYLHMRAHMIDEAIVREMPPDLVGSAIILRHKLVEGNNVYHLSEFGVDSDRTVDTSGLENFVGVNLWYLSLARYNNAPALKWIGLVFLLVIGVLLLRLRGSLRHSYG
jgi:hypothetical protein